MKLVIINIRESLLYNTIFVYIDIYGSCCFCLTMPRLVWSTNNAHIVHKCGTTRSVVSYDCYPYSPRELLSCSVVYDIQSATGRPERWNNFYSNQQFKVFFCTIMVTTHYCNTHIIFKKKIIFVFYTENKKFDLNSF